VGEVKQSNPAKFVGIIREISERVKAQTELFDIRERLSHVSRLSTMGEMAAGIAHEINQPLTAIASYAQASVNIINNAKQQQVEFPQQKISSLLSNINLQALRAGEVISRLRGFIKKRKAQRDPVDLNRLIDETIKLAKVDTRLLDHGIHLHLATEPAPQVMGDAIQIQQVLFNLIRNAIDAMEDQLDKPVLIDSRWLDQSIIEVSVSDSGTGVSKTNEKVLFTPFFTTKESGMGIGLSISQAIIQVHGGKMHHCHGVPTGSVFTFTLPATGLVKRSEGNTP
jgi:two-component system sensor kinase FixL